MPLAFRRLRRAPHVLVADLHVQTIRILHVKAVLILARIQAVSLERCRERIGIIVVDAEHEVRDAGLLAVAILATSRPALRSRLVAYREEMAAAVRRDELS